MENSLHYAYGYAPSESDIQRCNDRIFDNLHPSSDSKLLKAIDKLRMIRSEVSKGPGMHQVENQSNDGRVDDIEV